MIRLSVPILLVATAVVASCDTAIDPDDAGRHIGILEWRSSSAITVGAIGDTSTALAAPDTVEAGTPFRVTITTIGMSGCWRDDGVTRVVGEAIAVVTPWDRVIEQAGGQPALCTGALVSLPRDVSLTFPRPGTAILRVAGRRLSDGELPVFETTVIEKRIIVRENLRTERRSGSRASQRSASAG